MTENTQRPGQAGLDEARRRFGADRVTDPRPTTPSASSAPTTDQPPRPAPRSGADEAAHRFAQRPGDLPAPHTLDTTRSTP